jgi:hypothetical protein
VVEFGRHVDCQWWKKCLGDVSAEKLTFKRGAPDLRGEDAPVSDLRFQRWQHLWTLNGAARVRTRPALVSLASLCISSSRPYWSPISFLLKTPSITAHSMAISGHDLHCTYGTSSQHDLHQRNVAEILPAAPHTRHTEQWASPACEHCS